MPELTEVRSQIILCVVVLARRNAVSKNDVSVALGCAACKMPYNVQRCFSLNKRFAR